MRSIMMQESDDKELPQELKKLEGRNYVFEIRLNEYNSHNGLQNYTATKVYKSEEEINNKNRYNTKLIVHIYRVNRINNNCKVQRKKINIILK
jgi:hypothetical protein